MYYLIYASQSKHGWTEDELTTLLNESRAKNSRLGITGMLAYLNDRFIQILEGEKQNVKGLLDSIIKDTRHDKITVVLEGELEHRIFSGWSMGFESFNLDKLEQLTGFKNLDEVLSGSNVSDESHPALIFLKLFYEKNYKNLSQSQKY